MSTATLDVEVVKAVAVTAELCGRTFTPAAAECFVADLSGYPPQQVIAALARCRREVRGVLTLADVINRLDDGRPGADEAWAMMPHSEADSVVWSEEMAHAFGISCKAPDAYSARLAFREAYNAAVARARERREPVKWTPSLGHDPRGRDAALERAVEAGRLSYEHARDLSPSLPAPSRKVSAMLASVADRLRVGQ